MQQATPRVAQPLDVHSLSPFRVSHWAKSEAPPEQTDPVVLSVLGPLFPTSLSSSPYGHLCPSQVRDYL